MRKSGTPERNELVVCKITKLFPNSAYAELVEYGKTGMVHVSEVALKWVRDIREFLRVNQYVVCRVMRSDKDSIQLSIKRVRKNEAESKLNEFKRENRAEKLLEMIAKEKGKSLDDAYKEVGFLLQEEFGSLYKAFETALKNPDLLRAKGVPQEWAKSIIETAAKSFGEKVYEVKAELEVSCYAPNGVEVIKNAFANALKGTSVEARYLSSPRYMLVSRGKNIKKVKAEVQSVAEKIEKAIKASKGACTVKIEE